MEGALVVGRARALRLHRFRPAPVAGRSTTPAGFEHGAWTRRRRRATDASTANRSVPGSARSHTSHFGRGAGTDPRHPLRAFEQPCLPAGGRTPQRTRTRLRFRQAGPRSLGTSRSAGVPDPAHDALPEGRPKVGREHWRHARASLDPHARFRGTLREVPT